MEKLLTGKHLVKYITAQRLQWWGYLQRMKKRTVRKIME
jgi:hypothetical protein